MSKDFWFFVNVWDVYTPLDFTLYVVINNTLKEVFLITWCIEAQQLKSLAETSNWEVNVVFIFEILAVINYLLGSLVVLVLFPSNRINQNETAPSEMHTIYLLQNLIQILVFKVVWKWDSDWTTNFDEVTIHLQHVLVEIECFIVSRWLRLCQNSNNWSKLAVFRVFRLSLLNSKELFSVSLFSCLDNICNGQDHEHGSYDECSVIGIFLDLDEWHFTMSNLSNY